MSFLPHGGIGKSRKHFSHTHIAIVRIDLNMPNDRAAKNFQLLENKWWHGRCNTNFCVRVVPLFALQIMKVPFDISLITKMLGRIGILHFLKRVSGNYTQKTPNQERH